MKSNYGFIFRCCGGEDHGRQDRYGHDPTSWSHGTGLWDVILAWSVSLGLRFRRWYRWVHDDGKFHNKKIPFIERLPVPQLIWCWCLALRQMQVIQCMGHICRIHWDSAKVGRDMSTSTTHHCVFTTLFWLIGRLVVNVCSWCFSCIAQFLLNALFNRHWAISCIEQLFRLNQLRKPRQDVALQTC